MPVTREQKQKTLSELNDKFGRAKGVVFAQFSGLTVGDTQTVRRGLRESNIDYKVARKTLIRLAAKEAGYDVPDSALEGPIGVVFGYDDEIVAAQKMAEFTKRFEAIRIAGGIMEGKIIDTQMVMTLASIPSRDVLLAKFMGSAMSPVSGFVGLLGNVMGSFVRVVNAYKEEREKDAPAEAPKAAPAEEVAETEAEEAPALEAEDEAAPAEEAKSEEAPAEVAESAPESTPAEPAADPTADPTADPAPEPPAES